MLTYGHVTSFPTKVTSESTLTSDPHWREGVNLFVARSDGLVRLETISFAQNDQSDISEGK